MQIKFLNMILMVCAAVFFMGSFALADDSQPPVPQQPLDIKGSKKTVIFPHKSHEKIECVVCHHLVNDKPNFQKCADAGCHDNLVEKKGQNSLYFVMHNKSEELKHTSCLKCHAKIAEEKPELKKELTGCKGSKCHPD